MPMTPFDRKVALMRKRVSLAQIGTDLGVSRQFVSEVVRGTRRSERVEAAVAEVIGKPVTAVFDPREVAAA